MVSSAAVVGTEHVAEFAFLQIPDSPVEPVQGWAQLAGNEARAPRIEVRNKSVKPVKYVELGWIVSDQAGRQYMAGSLPSSEPSLYLPPGQRARVLQESTLNFSSNGQPVNVRKMTGFVNQVEFADGKVWVPNRQNLEIRFCRRCSPHPPKSSGCRASTSVKASKRSSKNSRNTDAWGAAFVPGDAPHRINSALH